MIIDERTRVQATLAANLRRLRIARQLSLSELARATGVSKATLSGIERGRCNPTVDTLASLAGVLRVSFSELLEELSLGEVRVIRASQRQVQALAGVRHVSLDSLAPATGSVSELALQPRQVYEPKPLAADARAHVYVVQGKLIAGPLERVTELAAGDYASFPADVPHAYESGRHPARALLLTQLPA